MGCRYAYIPEIKPKEEIHSFVQSFVRLFVDSILQSMVSRRKSITPTRDVVSLVTSGRESDRSVDGVDVVLHVHERILSELVSWHYRMGRTAHADRIIRRRRCNDSLCLYTV